ncbi:MAG TPA: PIG-L family deacetylase [Planctomycetes bacterium]|nr:PIG-L family deacetylase [Planctomycetota bacterium]
MRVNGSKERTSNYNSCAVIVAHPDDETLWAGGTILMHPEAGWTVVTLCRKNDEDRAPRFYQALAELGATGTMGDIDDGPEQEPLDGNMVQSKIVSLLPSDFFDLIVTHSVKGEYTRHLRHEETARAVLDLWKTGKIRTNQVWCFAYEDKGGRCLPQPIPDAHLHVELSEEIWRKKKKIITEIYGFGKDSFEAKTTPKQEAFWCFDGPVKQ